MEKDKKSILVGCMIIGATMILWSFFIAGNKSTSSKNVIVVATVRKLIDTNGYVKVDVEYSYEGKVLNNSFHVANADSLKMDRRIRLLVSQGNPDKDVKYIGVAK
ncbi:hypothetical protein HDF18_10825 [Mucilaginibacter sp. X5P1]|uniref:hypothetical protein n=1 Tax=Mucilaginibacter sp. X5P1 TaxID=2723088 RepID=UPI001617FFC2|nr:hypothetical protein [Mucilaginibacter sp. X5P1]MBB6140683.1 hypothetical protein [Mucilaginibacter sp. X5P1]